jgi:hypothetical protein
LKCAKTGKDFAKSPLAASQDYLFLEEPEDFGEGRTKLQERLQERLRTC